MSKYLDKAIKEIDNLSVGQVFKVSDLFKGCNWELIDLSVRMSLGRQFYSNVEYRTDINILNKVNGLQTYKKIK